MSEREFFVKTQAKVPKGTHRVRRVEDEEDPEHENLLFLEGIGLEDVVDKFGKLAKPLLQEYY